MCSKVCTYEGEVQIAKSETLNLSVKVTSSMHCAAGGSDFAYVHVVRMHRCVQFCALAGCVG